MFRHGIIVLVVCRGILFELTLLKVGKYLRVNSIPIANNTHRKNFLFIEINSKEMYLLETRSICFGLRNARVIAFKDMSRRVCSDDNFVEVVVRDMGRTSSCRISGIQPVDSKDQARAIVDERVAAERAAKDAEQN